MPTELTEQTLPEDVPIFCPECGAPPEDNQAQMQHQLSAMGYLHDDQSAQCAECGHRWTHGVPVGGGTTGQDLRCRMCRHDPDLGHDQFYRVHRVVFSRQASPGGPGRVTLHLKCPRCYHFLKVEREQDQKGVALVGYPDITGEVEGADEYGWTGQPPGVEGDD